MIYGMVFSFTVFFFEIPLGYFADKFGRKNSMIIGVLILISSLMLLYFTDNFYVILFISFLQGISQAFISGADSAILYDSLLSLKREKEFKKIDGRAKVYQEIGVITAVLIALALFIFGIKTLILFAVITKIILFISVISFKEPIKHEKLVDKNMSKGVINIFKILKKSLENKKLKNIFIYAFLIQGFSNMIFLIYQPYFLEVGIPMKFFGLHIRIFFNICSDRCT